MSKVKNAPDTGGLEPQDYTDFSSWIDFWESKKKVWRLHLQSIVHPRKYRCSKCGEEYTWDEFNGAHVIKVDSTDKTLYIYPICEHCNKERGEEPFDIIDSLLVPMPPKK